jgi:hypothetical protein
VLLPNFHGPNAESALRVTSQEGKLAGRRTKFGLSNDEIEKNEEQHSRKKLGPFKIE